MGIRKVKRQLTADKKKSVSGRALVVPARSSETSNGTESAVSSIPAVLTEPLGERKKKQKDAAAVASKQSPVKWWDVPEDIKSPIIVDLSSEQQWYQALPQEFRIIDKLPGIMVREKQTNPALRSSKALEVVMQKLTSVYQQETRRYHVLLSSSAESKADRKWMQETIKSGTMSDKVAAMALQVQESPFHELETLELLVSIANKKQQRPVQLALAALKDLFINNLLPDRPLRDVITGDTTDDSTQKQHIFLHPKMNMKTALLLYFESRLKALYSSVIYAIGDSLNSSVDFFKRDCLGIAAELLMGKPEQEALLLETIVNKLGDPSKPTASKAIDVLKEVFRKHPAMKGVVVREVRQFIYRPNLKLRPIFTAILLLAHVPLANQSQQPKTRKNGGKREVAATAIDDSEVAVNLVETYVSMFERAVREGEIGSRLLSALLSGINAALPYLKSVEALMQFVDPLFKLVHSANSFTTSTQALVLLSHLVVQANSTEKEKSGSTETNAFVRRFYRALYSKLLTDQMYSRTKNTMFLNLLYRSVKSDPNTTRALAFLKRIGLCALHGASNLAAALLLLMSEIIQVRTDLQSIISNYNHVNGEDEEQLKTCIPNAPTADILEHDREADNRSIISSATTVAEFDYLMGDFNATKREPEFAYAPDAQPVLWEMSLLQHHHHPSVHKFAESFIYGGSDHSGSTTGKVFGSKQKEGPNHKIYFDGDPTVEFTLMAFLNRFAFKNPKRSITDKMKRTHTVNEEAVNTSDIASQPLDLVAPDKRFFHKYFSDQKMLIDSGRSKKRLKTSTGIEDGDDGSDASGFDGADEPQDRSDEEDEIDDDDNNDEQEEDEEAEIDRFADKLAEDLMKGAMANEIDDNEDDESDSDAVEHNELEEEVEDSDEDDIEWDAAADDEDSSSKESESDDDDGCEDFDEEDDIATFGHPVTAASAVQSSSALDFDDFVAEQNQISKKKRKRSALREIEASDDLDEDEEEYDGLVAYGDEGFVQDLTSGKKKKKNAAVHSESQQLKINTKKKIKSKTAQVSTLAGADDFADADAFEELMEENVQKFSVKKK